MRRPRRPPAALGQHFLRSRALAGRIVDDACVRSGELIVDIGAGHGILTAELAARGARVLAVERDPSLAAELRTRFAGRVAVTVVEADASRLAWPSEPFRIVANLPFGNGTAILRSLLDDPRVPVQHAELILQWEVAVKRAAVWPSTLLGVYWGAWYECSVVRRLPRSMFAPPPAVDAGVLRLVRRSEPLVPVSDARAYCRFLGRAFAGQRPLRGVFPPRTLKRLAVELGFAATARARDLDAAQWAALFRSVRSAR